MKYKKLLNETAKPKYRKLRYRIRNWFIRNILRHKWFICWAEEAMDEI